LKSPLTYSLGHKSSGVTDVGGMQKIFIDAKFSSLVINWNPHAVKNLLAVKATLTEGLVDASGKSYPGKKQNHKRSSATLSSSTGGIVNRKDSKIQSAVSSSIFVKAQMKELEISLHSAKDDAPLFLLTMTGVSTDFSTSLDDDGFKLWMELGDFRLELPAGGKTLLGYNSWSCTKSIIKSSNRTI